MLTRIVIFDIVQMITPGIVSLADRSRVMRQKDIAIICVLVLSISEWIVFVHD